MCAEEMARCEASTNHKTQCRRLRGRLGDSPPWNLGGTRPCSSGLQTMKQRTPLS